MCARAHTHLNRPVVSIWPVFLVCRRMSLFVLTVFVTAGRPIELNEHFHNQARLSRVHSIYSITFNNYDELLRNNPELISE